MNITLTEEDRAFLDAVHALTEEEQDYLMKIIDEWDNMDEATREEVLTNGIHKAIRL